MKENKDSSLFFFFSLSGALYTAGYTTSSINDSLWLIDEGGPTFAPESLERLGPELPRIHLSYWSAVSNWYKLNLPADQWTNEKELRAVIFPFFV